MRDQLSHAIEDYLKVIYELTLCEGRASTNQIAQRMGVKPASVTGMVKRLAANDPPLLRYHKHRGVELTPRGEQVALEIIRHHRLLELYLHENLGFPWDQVHAEADRLEHVISEDLEERIAQVLGDPSHDPHGDPIPTRDLRLPVNASLSLMELRPGQQAIVQRVDNADSEFLRYLGAIGLVPQAHLTVLEHSAFDDNLKLEIDGRVEPMVLGARITRQIFVKIEAEALE
ncbi:MAG: metal-dependent transcriptional regulator [Anaerolineales bacterium]|nr:metal-dependent transcriptional regulator [Anaerolineales bacterium]